MAKITISSTRVYYNELQYEVASSIKHDINVYQSMRKKAYKELYDHFTYGNKTMVNPKYLKSIYHTNDYFPLSAISESKCLLKSQKTWYKKTLKNKRNKVKKIERKIKQEETTLKKYEKTLNDLIEYTKGTKKEIFLCPDFYYDRTNPNHCFYKGEPTNLYLFEVKYLKPIIKCIKNRIKLIKYRKQRILEEIERLEHRMKMIYFKKSNYIKITGRAQGKYCNNIFKYDHFNHQMLSEFSFRLITEKLYQRGYKVKIGINEVNPSYTSQIGKVKYNKQKRLSIHRSAAYVIARRGMGYKERLPQRIYPNINPSYETRWKEYLGTVN